MQHDEETLVALAHMQYDLFCTRNRIARSVLTVLLIVIAVLYGGGSWWSLLIIAYACYLITSTYASSNRTAHRLADQITASGLPFPASEFSFYADAMHIVDLPKREREDSMAYASMLQLGEDFKYYYIFRDQFGGYMIPKAALGSGEDEFRRFLEEKTGKSFIRRWTPLRRLKAWLKRRENEPEHL